jgi:hypothetical protein
MTYSSTTVVSSMANSGSYNWTIPTSFSTSTEYRLYIYDKSNSNVSILGPKFTIDAPLLKVTYPNGGEQIVRNTSANISWASADVANVKVELLNGATNALITVIDSTRSATDIPRSYLFNQSPGTYKIRVTDLSNAARTDMSDTAFTIQ